MKAGQKILIIEEKKGRNLEEEKEDKRKETRIWVVHILQVLEAGYQINLRKLQNMAQKILSLVVVSDEFDYMNSHVNFVGTPTSERTIALHIRIFSTQLKPETYSAVPHPRRGVAERSNPSFAKDVKRHLSPQC
ncbi:hypothetical protein DL98DRAFT_541518 [Cadophora sp. DSE1049]|nr:hypothetical protein DL98DRAFT_541518 [Cadophora sp. DSE1049]